MLVFYSVTPSSGILSAWAFSWAAISSVLISVYKKVCLTLIWIGCSSPGEQGPAPSHPACWMKIKWEITSSNTTKYHALRIQILMLEELIISFHRNHRTVPSSHANTTTIPTPPPWPLCRRYGCPGEQIISSSGHMWDVKSELPDVIVATSFL